MDRLVQDTGSKQTVKQCTGKNSGHSPNYAVMDYYDGNTVTGLWNYAQHYALNDNSFGTSFGPSTPWGWFEGGFTTYRASPRPMT